MITERTIETLCDKIDELRDALANGQSGLSDDEQKALSWLVYDVRTDLRHRDFGDDWVSRAEYDNALAKIEELENEQNDYE